MQRYLRFLLTLVLFNCCDVLASDGPSGTKVDMQVVDMGELPTGRPAKVNVWYPQGECVNLQPGQLCLADAAITRRVVILSPGAMGSAVEYAWLGEFLATSGLVVIGVNHYGEAWMYGKATVNPRTATFVWQRPQDISALLDRLASRNLFQRPIDWTSVIAIGHSEGGQTAAMLAGAVFDLQSIARYCDSTASRDDLSCGYAKNSAKAPVLFAKAFGASYKDTRIKSIVLLDPAIGPAAQPASLQALRMPVLVIGAANNDFLPWPNHGGRYAANIPAAETIQLGGQAGHFVFLSPCQYDVKVMGIALCKDRAGVDRQATQAFVARKIVAFLQAHAGATETPPHEGPFVTPSDIDYRELSAGSLRPDSAFTQVAEILAHTPAWVFAVLAFLIVFGLLQARSRVVRVELAFFLPVFMFIWSISGVMTNATRPVTALLCWFAGLSMVAALFVGRGNVNGDKFDGATRRFAIRGSWVPLFVMLGIYATRYFIGVATAMHLEVTESAYFEEAASLVLGAGSGFFVARGLILLRVQKGSASPPPLAA
jgi:predicted dienelactone hydrolase